MSGAVLVFLEVDISRVAGGLQVAYEVWVWLGSWRLQGIAVATVARIFEGVMATIGWILDGPAADLNLWGRVAELRRMSTFRDLLMVDQPGRVVVVKRRKGVLRESWRNRVS